MVDLTRLEQKLKIDEHALDVALREHPDLFYQVATELAMAISHRDGAKQDLIEIESEVDMQLRKAAAAAETKTTEKEVESNRKTDKRVIKANSNYLEAHLKAAKWAALKEAYESRSYALSKLVDLHLASYYSTNESKVVSGSTLRDVRANQVKEANRNKRVQV